MESSSFPKPPAARRVASTATMVAWWVQFGLFELARACHLSFAHKVERRLRHRIWRLVGPGADTAVRNRFGRFVLSDGRHPPGPRQVVGHHENEISGWLADILKPGMTMVDIGAHVGYFTIQAARLVGSSGRVVALEPMADNATLLARNLALNDVRNVTVIEVAANDSGGTAVVHESDSGNARHSMVCVANAKRWVEVPSGTLDQILHDLDLTSVDLVKVDVEGAELSVLRGAVETLRTSRPTVVVEYWPAGLEAASCAATELLDFLTSHGYEIAIRCHGRTVPVDGKSEVLRDLLRRDNGYVNLLASFADGSRQSDLTQEPGSVDM